MRDNQELIIGASGQMKIREVTEYALINGEAVARSLMGHPSFTLPLGEDTSLHVVDNRMFCLRRVHSFPIRAMWTLAEEGGHVFETPNFVSGMAAVSRDFEVPVPTAMITEVSASIQFPILANTESVLITYLLGMSASAPAVDGGDPIRRFHRYPLANVHSDGRLCTGALNGCKNIYDVSETAFESWKANRWNSDLWDSSKHGPCRDMVRFDPESGEQIMPSVATIEDIDSLFTTVAPAIPTNILNAAWELAYDV